MSEIGLEASSGFLEGRVSVCPLEGRTVVWPLVGRAMSRDMCGLRRPVC